VTQVAPRVEGPPACGNLDAVPIHGVALTSRLHIDLQRIASCVCRPTCSLATS
jgi:hypothetical protein